MRPVSTPAQQRTEDMYLEDYSVGQVLSSPPVTFSRDVVGAYLDAVGGHTPLHDVDTPGASVYGPHVQAQMMTWIVQSPLGAQIVAELDHTWHFDHPVSINETVTYEMTITRVQRTASLSRGVVHRQIEVKDLQGRVLQHCTSRVLVNAREPVEDGAQRVATAFTTKAWITQFRTGLGADSAFTRCTSTWDGVIGLVFGSDPVLIKVYKGRVLDAGSRTPHGPTFLVRASDKTWAELVTGPTNDFTRRAMLGQIDTAGDAYEYLRHTRTIVAMVDVMRQMAGTE